MSERAGSKISALAVLGIGEGEDSVVCCLGRIVCCDGAGARTDASPFKLPIPGTHRQCRGFLCGLSAANDFPGGIGHAIIPLRPRRSADMEGLSGVCLAGRDLRRGGDVAEEASLAADGLALVSGNVVSSDRDHSNIQRCGPCRPLHLSAGNRFGHGGDLGGGGLERGMETSAGGIGRVDGGGDLPHWQSWGRNQTSYWRNDESLWTRALACTSDTQGNDFNSVAHNGLGNALAKKGRKDDAIAQYRKALEINPAYNVARHESGNCSVRRRGERRQP